MAYTALDPNREGSTVERRSWSAPTSSCAARSCTAVITPVRFVRAPSLSLPATSFPTRSPRRSSRSHRAGHVKAAPAHGRTAPEIRSQQRLDHRSDRNRRVESLPAPTEEAWLSRVEQAAHCKSTLPIGWIACSSRNSRRLTSFWCPVASAPSAYA